MKKHNPIPPVDSNNKRNMIGAIVILFGILLLFKNLDFDWLFPGWLFSWPSILIVIGFVIGINSQFKKRSSYILIILGSIFLAKRIFHTDFGGLLIPIGIIILGAFLLIDRKQDSFPPFTNPPKDPETDTEYDWDKRVDTATPNEPVADQPGAENIKAATPIEGPEKTEELPYNSFEDYLRVDSIFANVKKHVLSKKFQGGNITNVFGSVKINLLQADIQQPVRIDGFLLFGSVQLIVPTNWSVHTNVASVFGDVDDRRDLALIQQDPQKKLLITGTCLFGSFTVKTI
ncbi:hypothetical protein J5U18_12850 [Sphingobacteriaceae bacterium WQ 2009]|uniref:LiaF transmembrane domain-containing protein n=1 Tax=Rhinopithecimicrobium faecis TaxID=2820698 RepID=A0A8T4HBV7_9SPHI|nr:hypothetical protein [Sphingobacteriaceae bacterium WQ 2009]